MPQKGSLSHKVLIVEDDPIASKLLGALLRAWNHQVTVATTVHDGLAALGVGGVGGVTHVILDLMLPDGTGIAVLNELHRRGSPVRVAVVSGEKGTLLQEAAQFRPDLILSKPINVNELLSWLSKP